MQKGEWAKLFSKKSISIINPTTQSTQYQVKGYQFLKKKVKGYQ